MSSARANTTSTGSSPEFRGPTRSALRERVAYLCSHPDCRRPTAGPHTDPTKVTRTGEAAHIRGAKPGAARHDPSMTDAERRDVDNGIWLCRNCHGLVDTDWRRYPAEELARWKALAEERARTEQIAGRTDAVRPDAAEPRTLASVPFTWVHDPGENGEYVSRTEVLARLDRWHAEPAVRTVAVHGIAGTGKTSLVGHWLRRYGTPLVRPFAAGLYWSFYSDRNVGALLDRVLDAMAPHVTASRSEERLSPIDRFERVARRSPPLLLVLDGIEVLQHPLGEGADYGRFVDVRLQVLLEEIARLRAPWLVISTSRFPLTDREPASSHRALALGPLTPAEALELLDVGGVRGPRPELERVIEAFARHPLALRLFAASIAPLSRERRTRPAEHLAELLGGVPEDAPFRDRLDKLLVYYVESLDPTQSLLLCTLSIFRTPIRLATVERVAAALAASTADPAPTYVGATLGKLRSSGVVLHDPESKAYSCHPVVLDTFRAVLLGVPEHQRRAVDLLTGRPDDIALGEVGNVEPLVIALEVLNDGGESAEARRIYRDRFGEGALFLERGLPHEAVRVFESFLSPRRPGFGVSGQARGRVAQDRIEREFLVPAAEFDIALGDLRSARRRLERAEAIHDWRGRTDVHRNLARVLHHEGDPLAAIAMADRSLRAPGAGGVGTGAQRRALALHYRIRSLACVGEIREARASLEPLFALAPELDGPETWVLGPMAALRIDLADGRGTIVTDRLKQLRQDLGKVRHEPLRLEAMLVAAHATSIRGRRDPTSTIAEAEARATAGDYTLRRCQASVLGAYAAWRRGGTPDVERLITAAVIAERNGLVLVQCEAARVLSLVATDDAVAERYADQARALAERSGYTALESIYPPRGAGS